MLQAIGLTSIPRRNRPPAVHDLTFEARPGRVTALFGAPGAGKTTALRLMLGLERGRGVTYSAAAPCTGSPTRSARSASSSATRPATRPAPPAVSSGCSARPPESPPSARTNSSTWWVSPNSATSGSAPSPSGWNADSASPLPCWATPHPPP